MATHSQQAATPTPSLLSRLEDRFFARRDALLLSPAFHRFAARFPLTRPIARREAQAAFDLCAGFVYSQVLLAVIRTKLLETIRSGPVAENVLIDDLPLPPERAALLIKAAASLGLLSRRRGGRIGLGMRGAAIAANPSIAAMVEHHAMFYADLTDPMALLRTGHAQGHLSSYWPYSADTASNVISTDTVAPYSALMVASQELIANDILDAHPFADYRRLLDVGGGEGAFVAALAAHVPDIELQLFDLPAVSERAAARLASAGLTNRVTVSGGNFLEDQLPADVDAMTLVRIVHDHDDARVSALFRNIRRALKPGGTLIVAEPMADVSGVGTVADVYFAFYLLAMGRGRPRSPGEIEQLLRSAGFSQVEHPRTLRPMLVSLLIAR
jgi:demethylspheroidene O-methyltransferase